MIPFFLLAISATGAQSSTDDAEIEVLAGPPVTVELNLRRVNRQDVERRLCRELHALKLPMRLPCPSSAARLGTRE